MKFKELEKEVRGEILTHALDQVANYIKGVMITEAPESNSPKSQRISNRSRRPHVQANLKKSIEVIKSKPGEYPTRFIRPGTSNGIDAFYAMFVERGHLVRTATSNAVQNKKAARSVMTKVAPNPFMRRTFQKTESTAKSMLDSLIQSGIKKTIEQ